MNGMELRHESAVTGVRRVDEWRVVVYGLESKVSNLPAFLPTGLSRRNSPSTGLRMAPANPTISLAQHVRSPLHQTPTPFPSLSSPRTDPTRTSTTITTHLKPIHNSPRHLPPAPQPTLPEPRLRHRHFAQPRRGCYITSFSLFLDVDQRTLTKLGRRKRKPLRAAYGRDDTQHFSPSYYKHIDVHG